MSCGIRTRISLDMDEARVLILMFKSGDADSDIVITKVFKQGNRVS